MNSIILCEGYDDAWMIGYFLYKACGWKRSNNVSISNNFGLPKRTRNKKAEIYVKNADKLIVFAVGGKTCFKDALANYVLKMNSTFPNERFEQVVVIQDKDTEQKSDILKVLQEGITEYTDTDYSIDSNFTLQDKTNTQIEYTKMGENFSFNFATIIIPFDEEGALETVLFNALKKSSIEKQIICDFASEYVDKCKENSLIINYLKSARENVKARFSALILIINPTRSTDVTNDIFMSYEWEKSPYICENFKLLIDLFS